MQRLGARLFLIDRDDRVLMIHERDPQGGSPWWLTPGGGVELGETAREAAIRETYEETGLQVTLPATARPVFADRRTWSFEGVTYDQHNDYFAARVDGSDLIRPAAPTEAESRFLLGHHWWSEAELRASDELIFPPELADLLPDVCAQLPPC
jgi:8-oxo-dGTP pyrophosphatase MutT (NUDIX family)